MREDQQTLSCQSGIQHEQCSAFETNVTLADSESYGEKYVLDTSASKNPKDSLRYIPVAERQRLGVNIDFTQRVVLIPFSSGVSDDPFIFDDPDLIIVAQIYEQLNNSAWFRIKQLDKEKGLYIIRGFTVHGRMVYYKEWKNTLSHIIRSNKTKIVPQFMFQEVDPESL